MKHFFLFIALFSIAFVSCKSEGKDYVETVVEDPTQGVIASIKEVKTDIFKIVDEEIVEKKEDSRIYAEFMDGSRDTFTLDQIRLTEYNDPRRSALRSIAMGGMLGYMMGRGFSSGPRRSAYADDKAFNKSTQSTSKLRSTAKRSVKRTPKKSSGFGSKKSTRSFGG